MAQPAPKAASDKVHVDANGKVTINDGKGPIKVDKGHDRAINFSYAGTHNECYLTITFKGWGPGPINNGGTVVVGS